MKLVESFGFASHSRYAELDVDVVHVHNVHIFRNFHRFALRLLLWLRYLKQTMMIRSMASYITRAALPVYEAIIAKTSTSRVFNDDPCLVSHQVALSLVQIRLLASSL